MALQLSGGDVSGLIGGPVAYVIYAAILLMIAWPLLARLRRKIMTKDVVYSGGQ